MNTQRIRELNDTFRQTGIGGRMVMTRGVAELSPIPQLKLIHAVRTFSRFTEDNDPHAEHDFGSVDVAGEKFFFKIDYYAPDMEHGSEDPADPKQTVRVMTIMHAREY